MVNGKKIKEMDKVSINGKTVMNIMVCGIMIKDKVLE